MNPDPLTLVAHSVDQLRIDMKDDLQGIKAEIMAVKEQTTATNGRVRALELWRARAEGFLGGFRWVPVLVGIALSAGVTAGVTLLLTSK